MKKIKYKKLKNYLILSKKNSVIQMNFMFILKNRIFV